MNLILLRPEEIDATGVCRLIGRRLTHAREVLRSQASDELKVGVVGGMRGTATVLNISEQELVLQTRLDQPPLPRAEIDVLLAIPRPKALKKVIPAIASLGINRLVLLNAARVEKSYFDSKVLAPEFLETLVSLGLEQAGDTLAPEITVRERFKPFVEDELASWLHPHSSRLLADPQGAPLERRAPDTHVTIAIGPEGGWVPFEVALLQAQQFRLVSVGTRPLRVEVALATIVGAIGI